MSYLFVFLLFLLSFTNSQYIATSQSYDKVMTYTFQYLQKALNTNLLEKIKEIEIADFTAEDYKVTKVKANSVIADFKSSMGNMHKNLFIVSPNKLVLNFVFSYMKGEKTIENVQLAFSVYLIRLTLSNELNQPVFSVEINNKINNFKVYDAEEGDHTIIEKGFHTIFNKKEEGKNSIIEIIAQQMKTVFTEYYIQLYANKKDFKFALSKLLGENEFISKLNTFMGFCEDPEGQFEVGICYFDGNVQGQTVEGLKKEPLSEYKFKNPMDDYYTFINFKLIISTLKNKEIHLKLTKDSFTDLSFGFKVKDIKSVFNIPEQFKDEDECTVDGIITILDIKDNGYLTISITHKLNIKDTENVIEFKSNVSYQIRPDVLSSTTFDLYVKNALVNDLFAKKGDIFDEMTLKGWIAEVMYNSARPKIYYSRSGISLKDYYRYINNVIIGEKGIFIEGKHIYF